MLSIRRAQQHDVEACSEVLCASIRTLCVADHKGDAVLIARWVANKTPEQMGRWLANPRVTLFLAESDGAPAGVGCISENGEVLLNYVAPAHRFRGVSRAMLAHLENTLRGRGVRKATLTSTVTAHRFYQSAGWTDVGSPELTFGITGYPMEKEL
jgi:GNAT superfamily N-acetyltransferase